MTRRATGESLTDDEVASSHADLLPELREELSLLSMMERARRSARSSSVELDAGARSPDAGDVRRLLDVRGYTVERELHRGGQGVVFEARQRSTGRAVAIKLLHDLDLADARVAARFEREARVLAMIDHPHVVKVIDTGIVAGRRYIAMDLIRGAPWTEYESVVSGVEHAGGAPDVYQALRRFANICDAVGAAHLRGVIHRDLKPGNILVDAEGRPHVLDFGLAKLTDAADSSVVTMTREGQFIGSLPWASPEQAAGNAELLDVRSDVYSLGVVLYQVLTGEFPYSIRGAWRAVAQTIAETPPQRPRALRADLDIDVEKILLKCLAKEPKQRYQSAGQLADDVRRFLAGEPIIARGGGTAYVLRRLARKHRFAVGAGIVFLVLLVAAAIVTTALYQNERRAFARAESERETANNARLLADDARDDAELETKKSKAVAAFLQDMLSSADPKREGKDVKVADLLDRATVVLQDTNTLKGQPLVEAAVRQAVGETYCGLGLAEAGAREFRKALELHRDNGAADSDDAIMTMHSLGTALWMLGRMEEAQAVIEEAMTAVGIDEDSEVNDEPTAELIGLYNLILSARGDFTNIIANAKKRLDYYDRTYGREDWRTIYALSDLGYAYDCNQRYEEAVTMSREALPLARAAKGPDDPLTLTIAMNLAQGLRKLNRTDEIEAIVRDVLEARRRTLPPDHPAIAVTLGEWAQVLASKRDMAGAAVAMEEALEIKLRSFGANHADIPPTRIRLASAYLHEKRFADAEEQLMGAFESLENAWCENRELTDQLGETIVNLYRQWNDAAKLTDWTRRIDELNCAPDESAGK